MKNFVFLFVVFGIFFCMNTHATDDNVILEANSPSDAGVLQFATSDEALAYVNSVQATVIYDSKMVTAYGISFTSPYKPVSGNWKVIIVNNSTGTAYPQATYEGTSHLGYISASSMGGTEGPIESGSDNINVVVSPNPAQQSITFQIIINYIYPCTF
jgi:hypothetical protein